MRQLLTPNVDFSVEEIHVEPQFSTFLTAATRAILIGGVAGIVMGLSNFTFGALGVLASMLLLGSLQWVIVKQFARSALTWMAATATALLLGSVTSALLLYDGAIRVRNAIDTPLQDMFLTSVVGVMLGAAQWVILRRSVSPAVIVIPAQALAFALLNSVDVRVRLIVAPAPGDPANELVAELIGGLLGGLAYGIATGLAFGWLVSHASRQRT